MPAAPARRTRCRPAPASSGTPVRATRVTEGQPLFTLLTDEPERFDRALASLEGGYDIGDGAFVRPEDLVLDRIG